MFKRGLTNIWKPKNPHSLEYLKYLHGVLIKNAVVTETNRGLLVEALRAIAEILIWGDQNDPSVFDFFLEKNMLGFFLRIMKQKCGRYVCTQLLQTLNILFENISNETSLYYLLSNNHVNSIITHRFDFSDEEILAYYISFLKTLSLKLNANTIHFFFNEHTNDFPLYTEAIKFFNHSESMVRIAVRTLTLNVYRVSSILVNDPAMLTFIRDNTAAPYFSNFVFFIANHVFDIDSRLTTAWIISPHIRDKLCDLIAEHLDHIHYMNDAMSLRIDSLNEVLTEQLLKKLFIPIYLGCLSPDFHFEGSNRVSQIMSLFLLSQVFLIITHTPLVEKLASILFLADENALRDEGAARVPAVENSASEDGQINSERSNCTDEEKLQRQSSDGTEAGLCKKPLLWAVLNSLNCQWSDHTAFYALCLIYSIYQNRGISSALLQCAQLSADNTSDSFYCSEIIKRLVSIFSRGVEADSPIRIVTLELCCATLKQICCIGREEEQFSALIDPHVADLVNARERIVLSLKIYLEREEIFLDLFEDEYRQMQTRSFSIEFLSTDATMLLSPSNTPLSGVDFIKRLPCGPQERARSAIRTFLILRQLLQKISKDDDDFDRNFNTTNVVKIDDCLNLSNSDLLACTVFAKDGTKSYQRFLVAGGLQVMLVEPDAKKLGYGVVRFVGFLQDCEVGGDKEDSRALVVNVVSPGAKARPASQQLLAAKLVFDDHIRCMAAKQRLTKGRQKARQYKMEVITRLLGLSAANSENRQSTLLPPPPLLSTSVGRRVPGYVAVDSSSLRDAGASELVHSASAVDTSSQNFESIPRKESSISNVEEGTVAKSKKQPLSRRHVRVLSAESVVTESSPAASANDAIAMNEFKCNGAAIMGEDLQRNEDEHCGPRRSSSLSPRVVPRFGVTEDQRDSNASPSSSPRRSATRAGSESSATDLRRTSLMSQFLFGKASAASASTTANNNQKGENSEPSIEMELTPVSSGISIVQVRDDVQPPVTASLQCFASNRRKLMSQVLDI